MLDNGLGALVVSDQDADKAAAALDVNVGRGSDPEGRPGLAHFLGHMLFLGTGKFRTPVGRFEVEKVEYARQLGNIAERAPFRRATSNVRQL